ncbi:MAG: hypothetical protein C4522_15960 [Desulfobacteraceae bacterium]|nr:MAG: hypothetical protein C4522_15960 [Desulfobacteraceae bacterium]
MIQKIINTFVWVPDYLKKYLERRTIYTAESDRPINIFFCICDHFEPYWNHADARTARIRINRWLDSYPVISERYLDSSGKRLKYSFFYPEEEYTHEDLNVLAGFCHAGYGEVEIHLHHDNDTSENLKKTLLDYKSRLYEDHGLLSIDKTSGGISYGFIHGNWALDNSRPDGRLCGVNDELDILQQTGCYADFTMPSAPDVTQIKKVNSIYYTVDDPIRPKSHETGDDLEIGRKGKGLLMVQGPISLNWKNRSFGILPRVENGGLMENNPPTASRIHSWIDQRIHIKGFPYGIFVKIYTHGTQEKNMKMLFQDNYLEFLLEYLSSLARNNKKYNIYFTSAREMTNIIHAIMDGKTDNFDDYRDYRYHIAK